MTTKEKILNTSDRVVFGDIAEGSYFYNPKGHLVVKTDSFYSADEVDYNAFNLTLNMIVLYDEFLEVIPLDKVEILVEGLYIEEWEVK